MRLSERLWGWMAPRPALPGVWDDERVFTDGDVWFAALLADLAAARRRIWLETYLLSADALSGRVLDALRQARARGCEVRLLVDGFGAAGWLRSVPADAPELRVWNPLPWGAARRAGMQRRWRWLATINRRDHRKVCLIDDERAWIGSFNLDARHLRELSGDAVWRDSGARVAGPGVAALAAAFTHAWRRAWPMIDGAVRLQLRRGPAAGPITCPSVRLNHTGAMRRAAYRDLLARLRAARQRIWITNAYLVPRGSFLRALTAAARRGVDVRLLAPAHSDVPFMPWLAAISADALLMRGVRVFAYLPRMLHAKTMLIDGHALVGSHNLNSRSFLHDLEAEVVLAAPTSLAALERAFLADCGEAEELRGTATAHLPWWQRLLGRALLLAKRFL